MGDGTVIYGRVLMMLAPSAASFSTSHSVLPRGFELTSRERFLLLPRSPYSSTSSSPLLWRAPVVLFPRFCCERTRDSAAAARSFRRREFSAASFEGGLRNCELFFACVGRCCCCCCCRRCWADPYDGCACWWRKLPPLLAGRRCKGSGIEVKQLPYQQMHRSMASAHSARMTSEQICTRGGRSAATDHEREREREASFESTSEVQGEWVNADGTSAALMSRTLTTAAANKKSCAAKGNKLPWKTDAFARSVSAGADTIAINARPPELCAERCTAVSEPALGMQRPLLVPR